MLFRYGDAVKCVKAVVGHVLFHSPAEIMNACTPIITGNTFLRRCIPHINKHHLIFKGSTTFSVTKNWQNDVKTFLKTTKEQMKKRYICLQQLKGNICANKVAKLLNRVIQNQSKLCVLITKMANVRQAFYFCKYIYIYLTWLTTLPM